MRKEGRRSWSIKSGGLQQDTELFQMDSGQEGGEYTEMVFKTDCHGKIVLLIATGVCCL